MITKQDILDRAAEWQLRPDVVEKDYVLGWILAALGTHAETSGQWVFKGGTCVKKCFVETYRFSEDLDFTLQPDAAYGEEGLRQVLREVAQFAHEASGLAFSADEIVVRPRKDRQGRTTFEARLGYRGPMAIPGQPKVRFDLTRHEEVVLPPLRRSIFHPYPDALPAGAGITCYDFNELLAEKTRALLERTRPRDLYDVVLIVDNHDDGLDLPRVRTVFAHKCRAKGLEVPSAAELVAVARTSAELESEWANMLRHQLPALPDLPNFLDRLPGVVGWLDVVPAAAAPRPRLASASVGRGVAPPLSAPRSGAFWGLGVPVEAVRFAGANRLMIEFDYHGKRRLAEPYSLRRPATGNLLLYAWETGSMHVKAFKVAEMRDVQVTRRSFSPRYRVEFTM